MTLENRRKPTLVATSCHIYDVTIAFLPLNVEKTLSWRPKISHVVRKVLMTPIDSIEKQEYYTFHLQANDKKVHRL